MKAHRTDGVSLTFGLIFLALTASWLANRYLNLDIPNLGWVIAIGLIMLGLAGVVASLRGGREEATPPTDDSGEETR